KHFTLAEANRTLPLVKRIVADLIALHPQWRDLVAQYEVVATQSRPEWGESTEQLALRARIDEVAKQINDFLLELDRSGACSKDSSRGSSISTASSMAGRCFGAGRSGRKRSSTGMNSKPGSRAGN